MTASACINNAAMPTAEAFLDCQPAAYSYGWLSPRISFSRDLADDDATKKSPSSGPATDGPAGSSSEKPVLESSGKDFLDFEFRLDDPVTMLPADLLFSDGKLVPLHLATVRPAMEPVSEIRSPEPERVRRRVEVSGSDPFAFSPRAPRCSSRWRELFGLKRPQSPKPESQKASASSSTPSKSPNPKSLKHFLHRNPKSASTDSSLSLPLLRDSDSELVSISSRRSLSSSSSSSSGPDHDDLPRMSLDSEKPSQVPISLCRNPPRVRISRTAARAPDGRAVARAGRSPVRPSPEAAATPRGPSVDSPRMNASGRVVFQGLERSSSSPGSFIGGPRPRPRGMERSYSANVRVLNVPTICSLRGSGKSVSVFGFGQLFSPQKRSSAAKSITATSGGNSSNSKIKIKIERASRE